ncbi:carbohydrate esterase family 16 protein [Zasmidium cellare ATCC 36951]|uniref:Carbohydrate esterase family 16 protein n=1 Tax=Zasmidium cellare ATCC 36951 TaxID=1080233 RepID=A0A6A6C7P0_ZASCE|nr:carbohydrate esterase family 16 protein [Zasmidium cellare ATCC 36951]KAF2163061.1 carbohydrate esterase family 16 protein [Zasmidium cellare ATCC 36951]
MFVFGDSYTTTSFNVTGAQPSHANPLGNPSFPGYTSSNGPNWVDFLTLHHNKTYMETVNLAYGGATVDSALVAPYLPTVLSVKEQIENQYLPLYADERKHYSWQSDNTLFASFIGINDVGNAYGETNASIIFADVWAEYAGLMERLYESGARNFLFLTVPPVNRSPLTKAAGASAEGLEAKTIVAWNANLTSMAAALQARHRDTTVFLFDFHRIFGRVLDAPCSFSQTCPYKNTTSYCTSYENGTPSWYTFLPECGVPVDEYFWLNSLHPTFRLHNMTAEQISELLTRGSTWSTPFPWS